MICLPCCLAYTYGCLRLLYILFCLHFLSGISASCQLICIELELSVWLDTLGISEWCILLTCVNTVHKIFLSCDINWKKKKLAHNEKGVIKSFVLSFIFISRVFFYDQDFGDSEIVRNTAKHTLPDTSWLTFMVDKIAATALTIPRCYYVEYLINLLLESPPLNPILHWLSHSHDCVEVFQLPTFSC